MENVIVVLILLAIAAGIIWYLATAKKRGEKCVGCPYAKECRGNCSDLKKKQQSKTHNQNQ